MARKFGAGQNVGPRVAPSMGGNDPRARRAPEATKNEDLVLAPPLFFDSRGRLAIKIGDGLRVINGAIEIDPGPASPATGDVDGGAL